MVSGISPWRLDGTGEKIITSSHSDELPIEALDVQIQENSRREERSFEGQRDIFISVISSIPQIFQISGFVSREIPTVSTYLCIAIPFNKAPPFLIG